MQSAGTFTGNMPAIIMSASYSKGQLFLLFIMLTGYLLHDTINFQPGGEGKQAVNIPGRDRCSFMDAALRYHTAL